MRLGLVALATVALVGTGPLAAVDAHTLSKGKATEEVEYRATQVSLRLGGDVRRRSAGGCTRWDRHHFGCGATWHYNDGEAQGRCSQTYVVSWRKNSRRVRVKRRRPIAEYFYCFLDGPPVARHRAERWIEDAVARFG
jgi:hypothetical protein